MRNTLSALGALAVASVFGCSEPPEPTAPAAPPSIRSFAADKTRITAGEAVTLSYVAENATEVELIDATGARVDLDGTATSGSATVSPNETALFVLRVKGEGGRDSAFVRVAVDEDLKDVFLAAVPPEVDSGGTTQLVWTAFNAASATLTSATGKDLGIDGGAGAGIVEVTPDRSGSYILAAVGSNPANRQTAEAAVAVHAALGEFTASTSAAKVGETVTFTWKTGAADEVILSEAQLGELKRVAAPTEAAEVDHGQFEWTVPATLPNGNPVFDGQPFRFALTVKQQLPSATLQANTVVYVGDGPQVVSFTAPAAVTTGDPVAMSWTTANAVQVALRVNGQKVFETLPSDAARVASGSYTLPQIGAALDVELVARSHLGAVASTKRRVAMVAPPLVTSFTGPATIASALNGADLSWASENAVQVTIRTLAGPVVFSTSEAASVAQGSTEVHPGSTTTYVVEAWNAAGIKATAQTTVKVIVPSGATVTPSPALPGTSVDVAWDLDPSTAEVLGIPTAVPVLDTSGSKWVELDGYEGARELLFENSNDAISRIPLTIPLRFPLITGVREEFWVSTNGFVTFQAQSPSPVDRDLDAAGGFEVIAPFWDDLVLGAGKVLYAIDGDSYPRTLVIQWNHVSTIGDPASSLTFQLQLDETGAFRFVYKDLQGAGAFGESATVGVELADGLFTAQRSHDAGTAVLSPNDQLTWFAGGSFSGSFSQVAHRTTTYRFISRLQTGSYVTHEVPAWIFAPGSVLVSEVMAEPGPGVIAGRWIELYNAQGSPVNVAGLELTTSSSAQPYVLPELFVPAHGYLVVGESTDVNRNGEARVDQAWTGLSLTAQDSAQVQLLGTVLSGLTWTSAEPGKSIQAPERAIDANGDPVAFERTRTFGGSWIGTPGEANETGFEYSVMEVPGAFEDISGTGTVLLGSASSYTGIGTFELPAPFPYFGQPQSNVNVSMVGFVTFGPPLAEAYNASNDTAPGSPAPNGVVAPFWDQLTRNTNGEIYLERKPGYTIISWNDFRIYATTSSLNFQVKLFDDGAIEFHYGSMSMSSSSGAGRESGSSATTWIERLDGSGALPVNINTAGGIFPDSGWRFTPTL